MTERYEGETLGDLARRLWESARRIYAAENGIRERGYDLRYVEYCEDAETPGLLGQIRGAVNHDKQEVKIGLKANPSIEEVAEALEHELRHIRDPDWDCGNRDVLGRGGPREKPAT